MNTFYFITTILAALLIILFVRTFRKTSLKSLFQNAKNKAIIEKKRKEHEDKGETAFTFERGKVVIYARTKSRANHEYRTYKYNQKKAAKDAKLTK
jgi:UPF0716 family protein affecting phage T7 exclusion